MPASGWIFCLDCNGPREASIHGFCLNCGSASILRMSLKFPPVKVSTQVPVGEIWILDQNGEIIQRIKITE